MRYAKSSRAVQALAALSVSMGCMAQVRLTDLGGKVMTGYYSTRAEDLGGQEIHFVPLTFDLWTAGFLGHPDFLSFDVKPTLTFGPQATEAGFIGGNGVSAATEFLRRRSFPLRLFYNNLRREDVYYGGMSQVSGYRSMNHDVNYGANWDIRRSRWPQIALDWKRSSLTSKPQISYLPEFRTQTSQAGATVTDRRMGWELLATLRRDGIVTDFGYPSGDTISLSKIDQSNTQMEASAQRPVWGGGSLALTGANHKIRSSSGGIQFEQDLKILSAGLYTDGHRRLKTAMRANYLAGAVSRGYRDSVAAYASGRTGLLSPGAVLEALTSQNYSNLSLSADVRYSLFRNLEAYFTANEGRVWAPAHAAVMPEYDYLSGTAGLRFERRFSPWATVTGDAHGTKGRTIYRNAAPGRIQGAGYTARLQSGNPERIEGSVSFQEERQRVQQTVLASNQWTNRWGDVALTRKIAAWGLSITVGGGYQRSSYGAFGSEFRGEGYSLNGNFQHSLGQGSYSRFDSRGNTLSPLLAAVGGDGGAIVAPGLLLPSLDTIQKGQTLILRITPLRRLEASALFTHVYQEMNAAPLNEYRQILVTVGYRFRLLHFEAGYAEWEQSLLGAPKALRNRLYFRVARPFTVISR